MSASNPFWNDAERRPRALWRLVLQAVLFVACAVSFSVLVQGLQRPVSSGGGAPSPGLSALGSMLVALAAATASMAVAARFLDRRSLAGFGFHLDRRWWADLGFGLALGPLLMGGIFLTGRALGWLEVAGTLHTSAGSSFGRALGAALLTFVCVGIYEEMISRGYHLLNVAEGFGSLVGPRAALVVGCLASSAVFGVLHAGNPNASALSTVCLIGAGLLFGLAYVVTGELALPIGLHISWNFAQGNVFGFPVSGTDAGASLVVTRPTSGSPDWWTGGAFGPEAGASGLLALLTAAVLLLLWTRWLRGTARPRLALAQYAPSSAEPSPRPRRAHGAESA